MFARHVCSRSGLRHGTHTVVGQRSSEGGFACQAFKRTNTHTHTSATDVAKALSRWFCKRGSPSLVSTVVVPIGRPSVLSLSRLALGGSVGSQGRPLGIHRLGIECETLAAQGPLLQYNWLLAGGSTSRVVRQWLGCFRALGGGLLIVGTRRSACLSHCRGRTESGDAPGPGQRLGPPLVVVL